jgi:hypothetical protein
MQLRTDAAHHEGLHPQQGLPSGKKGAEASGKVEAAACSTRVAPGEWNTGPVNRLNLYQHQAHIGAG